MKVTDTKSALTFRLTAMFYPVHNASIQTSTLSGRACIDQTLGFTSLLNSLILEITT